MFGLLKMPVANAPKMPPTACTPKTSSASSTLSIFLSPVTPHKQITPASRPMISAPIRPTLPAAGVMATRPATAPDAPPNIDGLPLRNHSAKVHDNTAAAAATNVFMKAKPAVPLASNAEPALKPNQPTHNSDAPTIVNVNECGGNASLP